MLITLGNVWLYLFLAGKSGSYITEWQTVYCPDRGWTTPYSVVFGCCSWVWRGDGRQQAIWMNHAEEKLVYFFCHLHPHPTTIDTVENLKKNISQYCPSFLNFLQFLFHRILFIHWFFLCFLQIFQHMFSFHHFIAHSYYTVFNVPLTNPVRWAGRFSHGIHFEQRSH